MRFRSAHEGKGGDLTEFLAPRSPCCVILFSCLPRPPINHPGTPEWMGGGRLHGRDVLTQRQGQRLPVHRRSLWRQGSEWVPIAPGTCSSESRQPVSDTGANVLSLTFSPGLHLALSVKNLDSKYFWRCKLVGSEQMYHPLQNLSRNEKGQFWYVVMSPWRRAAGWNTSVCFPLYFIDVLSHEIPLVEAFKPSLRFLCFILVVRWKNQPNI